MKIVEKIRKIHLQLTVLIDNKLKKKSSVAEISPSCRLQKGVVISFGKKGALHFRNNVKVKVGSVFECQGIIDIGDGSVVGVYNWFQAAGRITLGRNVIIGSHCNFIASSHSFSEKGKDFKYQPLNKGDIEIGNNVWIGSHVTILNNVKIGDDVIIGAHSLVNSDIPSNSIVVGSPARVIKKVWE
uniref:acyltransferase n=1 Tax=Marinobacterium profundum TaxID=1714300 RepID=UPI000829C2B7|nr:acyltransferase [Marinobacterium profundum]